MSLSVGEALANTLRNMIVPAKGFEFYDGDYSAIEARVLAWLAEEETTLDAYRAGVDTYKLMACKIYSCDMPEVTDTRRQLGKKVELGCGYGMGHAKFHASCMDENLDVSEELAENAVKTYRASHKQIVGFWYAMESAAIKAMANKGLVTECNKIKFLFSGQYLLMRLPSGRRLYYYDPRVEIVETKKFGKRPVLSYLCEFQGKTIHETSYGGKLVENATQAVARDLMASAMLSLENEGYMVVLTVHDEILAEVPLNSPRHSLDDFVRIMQRVPKWAEGMPLKVGAWKGPRYRK